MLPDENNRPSPDMEEIYKDFAIIHADSERALSLLRGLDEKLKRAIEVNPPAPGDGDRWHQFYGLRMNCLDSTLALLRQFDSELGQDILRGAEVAIAEEFEAEVDIQEANEANYEKEKAIALDELDEQEIRRLILKLGGYLGGHVPDTTANFSVGLDKSLRYLIDLAEKKKARKKHRDNQLATYLRKIQTPGISLLSLYFAAEEIDEDGNFNEDRDTLVAAAKDVILSALREINNAQLPY